MIEPDFHVTPAREVPPILWLILALALAMLSGCASFAQNKTADIEIPHYVTPAMPDVATTGSIFNPHGSLILFEDLRARHVGDILTVNLQESTDASKKAKTNSKRDSDMTLGSPTLFGRPVTVSGINVLETSVDSGSAFAGEGDSSQSNSLSGSITVTVVEVLFNGYLRVEGQKKISINQGSEYVSLSGIIRPMDVAPDNTVSSQLVANARISYTGVGTVAESNEAGWVSRFFISKLWPF
ncbi:MAG TPA: flagellar basal body L-ring protein FlgH [Chromatiales bacterium]|jgi:flagellar L-ring protein precursor FlgH|nr:flagellar basal body L-ring protein FlgH [Chromatiaceae bacterium]HIO53761.1 flagellar basal body L-ring protein FlgH [Chromatiales bacterium]